MSKNPKLTTTTLTETTPAPVAPQTKRYDDAFKRQAVENWIKTGKPGTQIAAELGLSYPSLKDWKRRYYGDATPERDDVRAENRVREQRDILKITLGIFPEPSRSAIKPSHPGAPTTPSPSSAPPARSNPPATTPGARPGQANAKTPPRNCGPKSTRCSRSTRAATAHGASGTNWPKPAPGTAANAVRA